LLIAAGCMGDHSQCAEMKNAQRPAHRRLRRLGAAKRSDHALIFTRDSACCCQRSVRGSSSRTGDPGGLTDHERIGLAKLIEEHLTNPQRSKLSVWYSG
jgi:hypothetical protein